MGSVKICITGPESTGKSSLTKHLSSRFGFPYVDEKARKYIDRLNRPYQFEDLLKIAQNQLSATQKLLRNNHIIFCDTDLLTLKIWAQDKYEKEIPFVEERYQKEKADLYLLCYPDLEWQPDPQREDENRLKEIYLIYTGMLTYMNVNYTVIKGEGSTRFDLAEKAVEVFLERQPDN